MNDEPERRINTGLVAASSLASALFGIIVGYIMGTGGNVGPSGGGPTYADADKVRRMLTEAGTQVVPLRPTRTGR